jgi:glutathione S-transferase
VSVVRYQARTTITVHHLYNSRSQRLLWRMEELSLDDEIVRHQRDKKTMLAPPEMKKIHPLGKSEMKKIHPLGKSPIFVHDGRVLVETGAVVEYIDEDDEGGVSRARVGARCAVSFSDRDGGKAFPPVGALRSPPPPSHAVDLSIASASGRGMGLERRPRVE